MGFKLLALLVAALAGLSMAVQGSLNTALGKVTGLLEATFVVQAVATLTAGILLFVFDLGSGDLGALPDAPWYTWLGGAIGVVITYGVVFAISRAGVASATTAIIVGQILTAALIDHLGILGMERIPFPLNKMIGLILVAAGARILLAQ
ncbi:MAG: DMT family transporter [Firmicutes bacterium]|nr:DMT family transporter [Bacillota bacterium]